MIRPWNQRAARLPNASGRTPGEGETLECVWQGVGLITGQTELAWEKARTIEKRIPDFKAVDKLEDLANRAKELAVDDPGFSQHERWQVLDHVGPNEERGYRLLYGLLIEPFCFLAEYERKDA